MVIFAKNEKINNFEIKFYIFISTWILKTENNHTIFRRQLFLNFKVLNKILKKYHFIVDRD
jgi:hypothetical protein